MYQFVVFFETKMRAEARIFYGISND